ncbi:unnamed protein product [Adineta steineri]|uniref:NAD(P)(+)--arginine ADP-ribosyltransferase n=1 Tax=Adineta steineri TaxID=433720 RepID=A0A819N4X5_9BILA|nr:unnamed protein product [Adineta steineri]CAF3992047.1 unnamed protein product [Adineta steineri]
MSGSKSNQNAAASSKSPVSSSIRQPRQHMAQNYVLLWIDTSIDQTNEHYDNTLKQIRTITGDINVFTQRDSCIDFLTDAQEDIKSFLVVRDTMFQQIMPLIDDISQLDGVYIYNDTIILHKEWTKKWRKIKSVHTNINDICQRLQLDIRQYHQDSITMSFITTNEMASTDNLNQLEPTFMYTQIFEDILLDMEHGKQAIEQFTAYCRHNNCVSPTNIERFEKEYHAQIAIWWYTFPSNIYSMLNYALRSMEGDTIINMVFFIHDLHKQIQQLHQQQVHRYHGKPFIVYRGQGLSKANFEKLKNSEAGLMSFNNFLSTSIERDIALELAYSASENMNMVGILFIMSIDPCIKSAPFASIKEESYFIEENEILFSMHTVFRVSAIKSMVDNNQLYQVELQLTSDNDQQLRLLTDRIREEADGIGWQRLGKLLIKVGQFNKAEELFNVLLEQTSDQDEKALYYNQLGFVYWNQADYEKALWYNEQGLEIQQKTLPSNHPDLATTYNSIGMVYHSMREYPKALSFYEKAFKIRQETLPSNHPDLAISYNNIALLYDNMGEYSKALSFYEKAIEIQQKTLPSNHSHLATSYINIGSIYDKMGEYSKALSFNEKTLEIWQKTLPSNHPALTVLYDSIGLVYRNMGENLKALSFYEKALEIRQKTLPSNHFNLAISYNNIGLLYDMMGEYSKALSFYEKTLETWQKSLSSDHPHLATLYCCMGSVYGNMREYSKAISSLEKAIEIQEKTLPSNQFDLATSYNTIASVYYNVKDYSKALSYYERALGMFESSLPITHPHIKTVKENIGTVKKKSQ